MENMNNKDLKAVIFDMDGVIVDTESYWLSIAENVLKEYDKVLSEEDKRAYFGCSLDKEIEIMAKYLDISYEEISELKNKYCQISPMQYKDQIIPGVKELIMYLQSQGMKMMIASSSSLEDIKRMIETCQLHDTFDYIVSGEMFEKSKPNPEIYNYAVDLLGIQRENIFVIEDSEYGIEAATQAGLETLVLKNTMYELDLPHQYLQFESHKDILAFMKGILFKEV